MQHAVQAEQQKNVDLRRELTEAREAQRKAVAELTAARDAQEKARDEWAELSGAAEGRLEKLEEKLQAKRDAIQELQDEKDQLEAKLDKKKKENRDLKEEVEELEEKVQKKNADEKKKQRKEERKSKSRGKSSSSSKGKGDGKGDGAQLCIPYVQGRCRRGDTCRDRHPADDLDSIYDTRILSSESLADMVQTASAGIASLSTPMIEIEDALLERVPPPERFNSNLLSFPAEAAGDPR
ncbi:Hypothetical protein SCF082_LOCUS7336 [Durusdinium trenchii]|uniref:C3H1-type domain-containing protein n=1 Tax=Durusdinium trenchii TaxID=1381693 RepID=A0ABP0IM47_9DINO